MNQPLIIIIALILLVLIAVVAYNMHIETQYRRSIRKQFGHNDRDALMESQTQSVRDGKTLNKLKIKPILQSVFAEQKAKIEQPSANIQPEAPTAPKIIEVPEQPIFTAPEPASFSTHTKPSQSELALEPHDEQPHKKGKLLLSLDDLRRNELPWFDSRFDYLAYVSLRVPQELHTIPRLSKRPQLQIVGCTLDGRFQAAEPIPGVLYQAFVIGLQAINRSGLVTKEELDIFGSKVAEFSDKMNGDYLLTDTSAFLNIATPLDELCARVDQTIAIHLVSRSSILGTELRSNLEQKGFQLLPEGAFGLIDEHNNIRFSVVSLDGSAFTQSLLASQSYKGFSMLFDITRVPAGKANFDEFMDLAVKLSIALNLDLVDDQIQELSNEWLINIRNYVLARQDEMLAVGIEPGSALAQRLFT